MDNNEGKLRELRKQFEASIDREIIESVFLNVDSNYQNAQKILLDMLSSTCTYPDNNNQVNGQTSFAKITSKASKHAAKKDHKTPNRVRNPSKREVAIQETVTLIQTGSRVLVLLRGIPGSGKSYLAKQIIEQAYNTTDSKRFIFSTDDYYCKSGRYRYDRDKIQEAHVWNQNRCFLSMRTGLSPVIVDNTNVKLWEMKAYVAVAVENGYYINVLEPGTPWAFNHHELAKRNTHDVPRDKIREMVENYEHNVTSDKLLALFGLKYALHMQPPQPAMRQLSMIDVDKRQPIGEMTDDDIEFVTAGITANGVADNLFSDNLDSTPSLLPTRKPILSTEQTLNAWGLTENALNSWNVVQTIEDDDDISNPIPSTSAVPTLPRLSSREESTNTSSRDFAMARAEIQNGDGRVIIATSRDITKDLLTVDTTQRKIGSRIATFEKGIMTTPDIDTLSINDISAVEESDLADLQALFTHIPLVYLRDMYEKCQHNLNWAVDLLLDNNYQEITPNLHNNASNVIDVTTPDNEVKCQLKNSAVTLTVKSDMEIIDDLDRASTSSYEPPQKQNKAEMSSLKKKIESLVQIGNEFYSDHVLNVRSYRQGVVTSDNEESKMVICQNGRKTTNVVENTDNVVIDCEDMDIDDLDMDNVTKCVTPMGLYEEFVELNLGSALIGQLESQFGDPHLTYPTGLLPTIQVPVTFARQLHAFYLESIFEQLENQQAIYEELCKEDEAFALKLQEEENIKLQEMRQSHEKSDIPQLAEIIQEQAARKDYYQSKLSADDLATRLTRQKLFDNFPSVTEDTLLEIFAAHDNNYVKTVEVLINTGLSIRNVDELPLRPPVDEETVKEMKNAEQNLQKNKQQHDLEVIRSADEYRQLALSHCQRRNELMTRAQSYHRRGMGAVAMFYSRLAREESDLFDQTNARAAESFLQEHSTRHDKFDTIDLHYLQAKEVVPALDIFLDRHINLLRGPSEQRRTETLYVVTGRGKHSRGGKSVIRPIVIARLAKRQIRYSLLNPGLLQIIVSHNSPITNDIR